MFKKIEKAMKILKTEGFNYFCKKLIYFLRFRVYLLCIKTPLLRSQIGIIHQLKCFQSDNPVKVFNFISEKYFNIFEPIQVKEEFIELLKIFKDKNPNCLMEIGTANGGTLFSFCKLARDNATIISIDLPRGRFGGGYPEWKIPIYQAFKKESPKLYLLREDSHKQETLEKVKKILGNNQLDFLFIDGDHTYEGVKKDFEMYSPLVKKGGVIAFHDIAPKGIPDLTGGVPKFWKEIKSNFKTKELIKDLEQTAYGIGIIFK